MKVYTHFYLMDENTAIGFRWRTLLQYGNSWEVIGSVVMKNPGGAIEAERYLSANDLL